MPNIICEGNSCMDCLYEGCMSLRLDRKGRLYTRCTRCGTITFRYCDLALNGLRSVWKVPLTLEQAKVVAAANQQRPKAVHAGARP